MSFSNLQRQKTDRMPAWRESCAIIGKLNKTTVAGKIPHRARH
jgi:hypothetical protein